MKASLLALQLEYETRIKAVEEDSAARQKEMEVRLLRCVCDELMVHWVVTFATVGAAGNVIGNAGTGAAGSGRVEGTPQGIASSTPGKTTLDEPAATPPSLTQPYALGICG